MGRTDQTVDNEDIPTLKRMINEKRLKQSTQKTKLEANEMTTFSGSYKYV